MKNLIQPLNFSRTAILEIENKITPVLRTLTENKTKEEQEIFTIFSKYKMILQELKESQKFILPNTGRFFENEQITTPEILHLPFQKCALEYTANFDDGNNISLSEKIYGQELTQISRKRIALLLQPKPNIVMIFSISHIENSGWTIMPYFATVTKIVEGNVDPEFGQNYALFKNAPNVALRYSYLYEPWMSSYENDWHKRAYADLNDEVASAMDFLYMLSCSNVETEKIEARKCNKSSLKRGVSAFDSYHVLKITQNKESKSHNNGKTNLDRKSPREHIRRGHIRRYENKNIFVQACMVNAGIGGIVRKDYLLV